MSENEKIMGPGLGISNSEPPAPPPARAKRRHPLFGSMKDVTWIAPGVDLTEPAMPEWADLIDEKYGPER